MQEIQLVPHTTRPEDCFVFIPDKILPYLHISKFLNFFFRTQLITNTMSPDKSPLPTPVPLAITTY